MNGKEIQIQSSYQENIWPVEADQGQIDQVLVNLYVNAWQAMTADMTLVLSTANVILEEADTRAFDVPPGPYVAVRVQDRGKGIAPEIIKRIFEPFFTTKKMGRGTGLGLASAFGIIKNHGGVIDVHSRLGSGTTFTIYLPAASPSQAQERHPDPEWTLNPTGTLLVVDDEPYILKSLAGVLDDLGYDVITANGGQEALARFRDERGRIDAVLLDMVMPDMNGEQVLGELKKWNPSVKVILSSGYSLNGLGGKDRNLAVDGFIQKPYQIEQLAAEIGRVLGHANRS